MRSLRAAAAALLLVAACSKKTEPAPAQAPAPRQPPSAFTTRDLANATAVDAALARLTLAASDLQAALAARLAAEEKGAPPGTARDAPERLLAQVEGALRSLTAAAAAVSHPGDRVRAEATVGAARVFVARLSDAVHGDLRRALPELFTSRDALGAAIAQYRRARPDEPSDAAEGSGAEREFGAARRALERVEGALGGVTRVAPRETGHELDPAAVRADGVAAAQRARAAAERIASTARDPALRYAAAQERALDAIAALARADDAERPAASRRYHAAKADALAALADYFAALASR